MTVEDMFFKMIFSICTSVLKHIAFLLLWVRTNAQEFIRKNSFVLVSDDVNINIDNAASVYHHLYKLYVYSYK